MINGVRQSRLRRGQNWALIAVSNALPWPFFAGWRASIYRMAGAEIGKGVKIFGQQLLKDAFNLKIDDEAFVGARCIIDSYSARISIGAKTEVGAGVTMTTAHHAAEDLAEVGRPVTIGKSCWIGAGCHLLPGCTIADGSTVGAGTVMLGRSYPAGVYAGVPGRLIRAADR